MSHFLGAEAQLAEAQRIARIGSWEWDRVSDEVTCSQEMLRLAGLPADEATIIGASFYERIHRSDLARVQQTLERAERTHAGTHAACTVDHAMVTPDGTTRYVQTRVHSYAAADGRVLVGTTQDMSERRDLEQQLRHAQKMEALGRLAGGIAHDFNNLLAGITVNADLLLDGGALSGEQYEEAMEIRRTSERAAALTRQLLAFGRKQGFRPEVLDVNLVVRDLERMLRRLLNARVELTCVLDPRPCHIEADRGQLEQALVNLVVNARDAMPSGGTVAIETRMRSASEGATDCVTIAVRDTGHGMDCATQERLFEPFFTTKAAGQGTGLGLATVYGIVQQARGSIAVESAPGRGAEFKLTFPRSHRVSAPPPAPERRLSPGPAAGTILLVEDEGVVLDSVRRTLERRGYRVIEARHAADAMRLFDAYAGELELVLSDAVMPGVSGPELVEQMRTRRPDMPLILMSGYSKEAIDTDRLAALGCSFLEKPFSRDTLLDVVADAMQGQRRGCDGSRDRGGDQRPISAA